MHRVVRKAMLITNIPNPYRVPLFNELHKLLEEAGISLLVVFGALGYERRKFRLDMSECEFPYTVLPTRKIQYRNSEKISFTYSGLLALVRQENPDVIVTNAFSRATLKLWFRSWFRPTPYVIWSGAIRNGRDKLSFARKIQRRLIVSKAEGFIVYGNLAKEYLVALGAHEEEVSVGINTVDTEFYYTRTRHIRREQSGKDRNKILLCVTYLEPRKHVESLMHIVRYLSGMREDFRLVILGDGPELGHLQDLAGDLGIAQFVSFEGFVQKADIPGYMAGADVFLFPTKFDIWGLVLVEAMAAGLPCIASIHAGATHDLVREGETGFAADFDDDEYIAGKINWLLDNPNIALQIGEASARMIRKDVCLEKSAEGFVDGIKKALKY